MLRTIAPLDLSGATPREIQLTQDPSTTTLVLGIDGVPSWQAMPLHAMVGETDVWTITNTMLWDHPFHLHGFFFQALDPVTGDPLPAPEWLDTFNVTADAGMMGMLMVH